MAFPDYQIIMLLLQHASNGKEHSFRDTIDNLAAKFNLSNEEKKVLLPSGQQEVFNNRVGWARTYLKKAGLIETTRRGHFQITSRGKDVLCSKPKRIDVHFFNQFEEFKQFRALRHTQSTETTNELEEMTTTPEESLESSYKLLRDNLDADLIQQLKLSSPSLFKKIVVELLVKMGYGDSRQDAGRAIGKSGDEGIDGIIKEDPLGLDMIYIQAKRWENTVGWSEVQKIAGALQGQRARKGIMN